MKAKTLFFIAIFFLLSAGAPSVLVAGSKEDRPAYNLCKGGERIVFSCKTAGDKGKILSLCATANLSESDGQLFYRFGKQGQIEMEYPKGKVRAKDAFRYERFTRPAQGEATALTQITVTFTNEAYTYAVMETTTDSGRDGGVKVTLPGGKGKSVEFSCQRPMMGQLMDLEDKIPSGDSPDRE